MDPREAESPGAELSSELSQADPTVERLRPRLEAATKEALVALVERLARDSEELAARLDYLTDSSAAVKALQGRIGALRRGKRFIAYGDVRDVAVEMATIVEDIRADVLSRDPESATALAQKFVCLDHVILDRADDSNGLIGDELRAACVLWLDAAAAQRAAHPDRDTKWPAVLHELYQANDYGVREPLLEQAHRLLPTGQRYRRALPRLWRRCRCAPLARWSQHDER
jgi:hypothetical protein